MNESAEILSQLVVHMKYSRYQKSLGRRETWAELVTRNMDMHIRKYPELEASIRGYYELVFQKKVLPSMRALQFGGKPIEISPNRGYNCSFTHIDHPEVFPEIMFLLLGGSGVGYSVQKHHVEKLPEVKARLTRNRRFLVSDSIEGWADAIKVLMRSYFGGLSVPRFDYSDIREKGTPLVTSGGKAPGPQPLHDCIHHITAIMEQVEPGTRLSPLQAHDVICHIADAVLSGGIRRAACLALFSMDDEEMMSCKTGDWWEANPQRGRSNNSVCVVRHKIKKARFMKLWERIAHGGGDPSFYFTNDKEWGTNPCGEISMKTNQFCNLATINLADVVDQADFNARVEAATFLATLQATYTDFHYLRNIWQKTSDKEALIGVSLTGIASDEAMDLDFQEAAELVLEINKKWAAKMGINSAARATTIKPSGTSSLVLGCSSGIHAWWAPYYVRRLQVLKNEAVYKYMKRRMPQLVEDSFEKPTTQAVISIPMKAPDGAVYRHEPVLDQMERIKQFNMEWVHPGHVSGENTNNISATLTLNEDDWDLVGRWLWENKKFYNGLTIIPRDGGNYKQAPHEEITPEQYEDMMEHIKSINMKSVTEEEDNTNLTDQVACGGGSCELK